VQGWADVPGDIRPALQAALERHLGAARYGKLVLRRGYLSQCSGEARWVDQPPESDRHLWLVFDLPMPAFDISAFECELRLYLDDQGRFIDLEARLASWDMPSADDQITVSHSGAEAIARQAGMASERFFTGLQRGADGWYWELEEFGEDAPRPETFYIDAATGLIIQTRYMEYGPSLDTPPDGAINYTGRGRKTALDAPRPPA
jgi:hypothetical protein